MDPTVARLHTLLARALEPATPDGRLRPVTVAEIYQDLVPYRVVRTQLGLDLNADYEYALMRLLAGEGGLLRLEPQSAREELIQELQSPNPNVGLFRKFAACDVWVAPARDTEMAGAPETPLQAEEVSPAEDEAPSHEAATAAPNGAAGAPVAAAAPGPAVANGAAAAHGAVAASAVAGPDSCPFCGGAHPGGRTVRFCPHCGADQRQRPCPECGEVLEREWRYCITCGAAVGSAGGR